MERIIVEGANGRLVHTSSAQWNEEKYWLDKGDHVYVHRRKAHAHAAVFGSELLCKQCNPFCYLNHGGGDVNKRINFCGHFMCPMRPIGGDTNKEVKDGGSDVD